MNFRSLIFLFVLVAFSSLVEAKPPFSLKNLTPEKCKRILLDPASEDHLCDICLRNVLKTSFTRQAYIEKNKNNSSSGKKLENVFDAAEEKEPERVLAGREEEPLSGNLPLDLLSSRPALKEEEGSLPISVSSLEAGPASALNSGHASEEVSLIPQKDETRDAPAIEKESISASSSSIEGLPGSSFHNKDMSSLDEKVSALPSEKMEVVQSLSVSSQPIVRNKLISRDSVSKMPLSARDAQHLLDHLPDPVAQRVRAIQTHENKMGALANDVRNAQAKIDTIQESIEKNKAIISGKLPLPSGATLKGIKSRMDGDLKSLEIQEKYIQGQTIEIQSLQQQTMKLQKEMHGVLSDENSGILASRYATKLENQKGEIVRKQAVTDLSILTLSQAQEAEMASTGISFGFEIPIEQQMKNMRLAEHLSYLSERLKLDNPEENELAEQLEAQAQRLKEITPLPSPQKKIPEIRFQTVSPSKSSKKMSNSSLPLKEKGGTSTSLNEKKPLKKMKSTV